LGSDSGKIPGSDLGKESGTISGKNPGKRPRKKSGKELPDWVKTRVRRPIQQGDKVEFESNKKGQSELKEEI
jgi:2-keto-4-pentenoate hydratase/2-oxohepta-3-ene-1,7-dioic acid hydratase in catechol pathway